MAQETLYYLPIIPSLLSERYVLRQITKITTTALLLLDYKDYYIASVTNITSVINTQAISKVAEVNPPSL